MEGEGADLGVFFYRCWFCNANMLIMLMLMLIINNTSNKNQSKTAISHLFFFHELFEVEKSYLIVLVK